MPVEAYKKAFFVRAYSAVIVQLSDHNISNKPCAGIPISPALGFPQIPLSNCRGSGFAGRTRRTTYKEKEKAESRRIRPLIVKTTLKLVEL